MTLAEYFNKLIREVNGIEEEIPTPPTPIETPEELPIYNSPIVEGLRFGNYDVLFIDGNKVYCTLNGNKKCYSIKTMEERYSKWQIRRERRLEKERAWDKLALEVKERDGFRCTKCGADISTALQLHTHHIIPKSEGGLDEPSNLTTLCIECHAKAHAGTPRGDFLKRGADSLKNKAIWDYVK